MSAPNPHVSADTAAAALTAPRGAAGAPRRIRSRPGALVLLARTPGVRLMREPITDVGTCVR